jgi:hypothetical protein
MKKLAGLILILVFLFVGCAGMPTIQVDPSPIDIGLRLLGYGVAKNNPELAPHILLACDALLGKNEAEFQKALLKNIIDLDKRLEPDTRGYLYQALSGLNIRIIPVRERQALLKAAKDKEEPQPLPADYPFEILPGWSERDCRVALESFRDGVSSVVEAR